MIYVGTAVEVDWWANRFLNDPELLAVGFDIEWRVTFKKGKRTGNYGHSGLRSTFETAVTLYVDSPCPAFSPTASAFICCCCSSAVDTPISAKCTHAGEVPRPAALVQLAYRWHRPGAGQPPYTCVLLHVAASGLTPALRALLQSPHPLKVVWEWNFAFVRSSEICTVF